MRVVVVDDEAPARTRLTALLHEFGGVQVVGEAENADAARAAVAALAPDVLFLDIEMPAERGTELAATLPEPRPFIVFATAYERFAVDAFQYDAADYLLKPVTRQRLQATLDRLRHKLRARHEATREVDDAVRAQSFLLPRSLPDVPGFAVSARTLPARAVGGDFYDAEFVDDEVAFVTSANFTEWAQQRNIEAGVLSRSRHFAHQLRSQFDGMVQSKAVMRLPGF